jgi:hypothetical protein
LLAHRTDGLPTQETSWTVLATIARKYCGAYRFFKPRYSLREVAQYSNPGFFVAGEVAAAAVASNHGMISSKNACLAFGNVAIWDADRKICKTPTPQLHTHWSTAKSVGRDHQSLDIHRRSQLRHIDCRRHVEIDADVSEQGARTTANRY